RAPEAGAHLRNPRSANEEEWTHFQRGRAADPARRLRIPALAGLQLPAGTGRHLRFAVADQEVRSADWRYCLRPDPPAEGHRALLRTAPGRGGQLREPRYRQDEDALRQPDAALS